MTATPLRSASATFSAVLPHALMSQKVVSVFSQVPSGFLDDFYETTVNVANAFAFCVNFNSGSATKFPVIVIGALILHASRLSLVCLLCLVFFLFHLFVLRLFHPKYQLL